MKKFNEILQFHVADVDFSGVTISERSFRRLDSCIATLTEISQRLNSISDAAPTTKERREIYYRFIKFYRQGREGKLNLNNRELKRLSFALDYTEQHEQSIFDSPELLNHALDHFRASWSWRYLSGLLYCYLTKWNSGIAESKEMLSAFLKEVISSYTGQSPKILTIQNNLNYLNPRSGDVTLGYSLATSQIPLSGAASYLKVPGNWVTAEYFMGVILGYLDKTKYLIGMNLEEISKFLTAHTENVTGHSANLIVISHIILHCKDVDEGIQENVKSYALGLVGDPESSGYWNPSRASSDADKLIIKQAKAILTFWITRQFIKVFFEKCINDKRRKAFWLKYTHKITRFKVVGSTLIRRMLSYDNRINQLIDNRFSNTNSDSDRNAALMFVMGDYLFVEFSDFGAFYAYKISNPSAPKIDSDYFHSTSHLKVTSLGQLVKRSGWYVSETSDEGRLSHIDGNMSWENVVDYWLKNVAKIHA